MCRQRQRQPRMIAAAAALFQYRHGVEIQERRIALAPAGGGFVKVPRLPEFALRMELYGLGAIFRCYRGLNRDIPDQPVEILRSLIDQASPIAESPLPDKTHG